MFSGLSLEGYENSQPARCQYDPKLETALSQGKTPGVQSETGEAEEYGNKASSAAWMSQVEQNSKRHLFKHAHDWHHHALPEDVKDHVVSCEEMVGKACDNKWLSLAEFKSAWLM